MRRSLRSLITVVGVLALVLAIGLQVVSAQGGWTSLADAPDNVKEGGALVYDGSQYIYALRAKDSQDFWRYDTSDGTWDDTLSQTPDKVKKGGALAYDGSRYIYALRAKDSKDFWRYDTSDGTWDDSLSQTPDNVKEGGALAYDGSRYIYALRAHDSQDFWRYDTTNNTWDSTLSQTPGNVKKGGALAYDGSRYIYALRAKDSKDFWRYDTTTDTWDDSLSQTPDKVEEGGALAYDGSRYIYALRAHDSQDFWRYDTSDGTWDDSLSQTPDKVKWGGALAYDGSYVYALQAKDSKGFWRYDPAGSSPPSPCPPGVDICVDGLLDSNYSYLAHFEKSGSGNEALAPGNLYGYEGTDTCYWAFVVDRAFNDNVYADKDLDNDYLKQDGWVKDNGKVRDHKFGSLKGSDHAIFDVTYTGGSHTDLTLDYLDGDVGDWSSGQTGKDGSANPGTPPIDEAATSLHWNLENSGWDGGTWGDPLKHSPPYTTTLPWEWHMIYEFSIPKSEMNGECGDVVQSGAHNSPSKDDETGTLGKIGDYVWHDVNINGVQDDGGPSAGIANVTVHLYDDTDTVIRTTQTAPSGYYIFNNLTAGDYYVEFVLPNDDYEFSPQDRGGDDEVDSDADPTTGKTITTTLEPGNMIDLTWDAGLHLCSIGDRVWNDESWNGDQNGTEPGLNGVDVYLFTATPGITPTCAITETGYVTHTVTISGTSQTPAGYTDGIYLFDMESLGLPPADYWVCMDEDTLPTGQWALTTGSNPQQVTYAGGDDFSIDFGYAAKVDLALTKTLDTTSYGQGDLVTFSITVTNEGSVDATGVKVEDFSWTTDTIEYESADSGGVYSSTLNNVIWDVGNLDAGASATVHITFRVTTEDGSFSNEAEIYACDQEDVDSTPNNGWVVVPDNPPSYSEDDIDRDGGSVTPTAVTLSSFAARSSASNSPSPLWLGLVGTVLVAGSLFWIRRQTSQ